MRYYTGVGSRRTPPSINALMVEIAEFLKKHDFVCRSGGAEGADSAFAHGANPAVEIYRPEHATLEAMKLASSFHPAWNRCSDYAKRLHGRNAFQVLGLNLNAPSEFLICWTADGCLSHETRSIATGGTGTAISIASAFSVPVHNLYHTSHVLHWKNLISKKG